MTRIRQQNVTAAQWSANGSAIGAIDLTLPENEAFGANVFSVSVQRERLPDDLFEKLQGSLEAGEAIDLEVADAVGRLWETVMSAEGAESDFTAAIKPIEKKAGVVVGGKVGLTGK